MKEKIIIVDLDGTVYNSTQRSAFIEAKDWEGFHAASVDDPPNDDVVKLLQVIDESPMEVMFIAITGRNERYRQITLEWLSKNKVPVDAIYMRGNDDYRKDAELKEELLMEVLNLFDATVEDIWFAIEDRDRVVDMWRGLGIPCYQVREGTY